MPKKKKFSVKVSLTPQSAFQGALGLGSAYTGAAYGQPAYGALVSQGSNPVIKICEDNLPGYRCVAYQNDISILNKDMHICSETKMKEAAQKNQEYNMNIALVKDEMPWGTVLFEAVILLLILMVISMGTLLLLATNFSTDFGSIGSGASGFATIILIAVLVFAFLAGPIALLLDITITTQIVWVGLIADVILCIYLSYNHQRLLRKDELCRKNTKIQNEILSATDVEADGTYLSTLREEGSNTLPDWSTINVKVQKKYHTDEKSESKPAYKKLGFILAPIAFLFLLISIATSANYKNVGALGIIFTWLLFALFVYLTYKSWMIVSKQKVCASGKFDLDGKCVIESIASCPTGKFDLNGKCVM